jgi:hypothetical protein
MDKVDSDLVKLFLGAVIIFSIGLTLILTDMYNRIGRAEHVIMHLTGEHASPARELLK